MKLTDRDTLMHWCRQLQFEEDQRTGLGSIAIRFRIRDDFKDLKRIYETMSFRDAKDVAILYIDRVASPCEDYDEDMEYNLSLDEESEEVIIKAIFRM